MIRRYELSDAQWQRIAHLLPGKAGDPGRHAADNRLFVHGVLWILRSGARWSDLPARYGKYKTVHRRFGRWADKGVWEKVFTALIKDPSNDYVMLDAIAHDASLYRERNRIERCFNKLKHFRRIATRYDRHDAYFLGFLHLACTLLWLR